jgi:hypothetical protein
MQGNIALESGDVELARFYFLAELQYATKTKHMRLLRAVDLLENWLVAQPPDTAREHATWLMTEWCNRGFSTSHPQVNQALEWLIEYRTYIPGHSQVG